MEKKKTNKKTTKKTIARAELDKNFYSLFAIEKAVEAFKDVCSVNIGENQRDYPVILSAYDDTDIELIKDEFLNYVLGIMKEEKLT
ncbi:HxsD-like protein [Candidatus Woesearchaeota archaeon]|nr:HxsD-like protein [Candidatus Woesearchaeota archaeon]